MLTCSWQLIKTTNTFFNNLWPILLLHKTTITNDWPSNFQNGPIRCKVFGHLSMNFPRLILNSAQYTHYATHFTFCKYTLTLMNLQYSNYHYLCSMTSSSSGLITSVCGIDLFREQFERLESGDWIDCKVQDIEMCTIFVVLVKIIVGFVVVIFLKIRRLNPKVNTHKFGLL